MEPKKIKRAATLILAAVMSFGLCACREAREVRTPVNVLSVCPLPELEAYVESVFTDADLVTETWDGADTDGESMRRLETGASPELVFTVYPVSAASGHEGLLEDIGGEAFSASYEKWIMRATSVEGGTAFIPLPSLVSGIIVNRTLAAEYTDELPYSFEGLADIILYASETSERGKAVFAVSPDEGMGLAGFLFGCIAPDFLTTAEGMAWQSAYASGNARMTEKLVQAMEPLRRLYAEGCLRLDGSDIYEKLKDGTLMAAYASENVLERLSGETEYEYVMLPFTGAGGGSCYVSAASGYLGISASARDGAKECALHVLEAISTEEGQRALISDMGGGASYLSGFENASSDDETEVFSLDILGAVCDGVGSLSAGYIKGEITAEELLSAENGR